MNLAGCPTLTTHLENQVWFRAIQPQHYQSALGYNHTANLPSRYSPAKALAPAFPVLYFAENQQVALFEVGALLGSPYPGGIFLPNPRQSWILLNVQVTLQRVIDLSDIAEQAKLSVSAQELTGEWRGYQERSPLTSITQPTGAAPTQLLGQALFSVPYLEGFRTISAKIPTDRNLVVFPTKLQRGSSVVFTNTATGQTDVIRP